MKVFKNIMDLQVQRKIKIPCKKNVCIIAQYNKHTQEETEVF